MEEAARMSRTFSVASLLQISSTTLQLFRRCQILFFTLLQCCYMIIYSFLQTPHQILSELRLQHSWLTRLAYASISNAIITLLHNLVVINIFVLKLNTEINSEKIARVRLQYMLYEKFLLLVAELKWNHFTKIRSYTLFTASKETSSLKLSNRIPHSATLHDEQFLTYTHGQLLMVQTGEYCIQIEHNTLYVWRSEPQTLRQCLNFECTNNNHSSTWDRIT